MTISKSSYLRRAVNVQAVRAIAPTEGRGVTATKRRGVKHPPPRHLKAKMSLRLVTIVRYRKKRNNTTFPAPIG